MIRYQISYMNAVHGQIMMGANQGRHHFDDVVAAQAHLDAVLASPGGEDRLVGVYGEQSRGTFRVSAFHCYETGDATGVYPLTDRTEETDP